MIKGVLVAAGCFVLSTQASAAPFRLTEEQLRLARAAVRDGNEQAAYRTCGDNGACRTAIMNEMADERRRWGEETAQENAARAKAKEKSKRAAIEAAENRQKAIGKKEPIYVAEAIGRQKSTVDALDLPSQVLDSLYLGVSLRAYISVVSENPDIKVFAEKSAIAHIVIVVKPKGQKSYKYYFKTDYGDLSPVALETPLTSNLKLVALRDDGATTFASLFFSHYQRQLETAVN